VTGSLVKPATYDCRQAFGDELMSLARADPRIVAVCNASVGSSNLVAFRDEFPDRMINVGIAEQDLVGVSAGLANVGLIPFVSAAAPFLTGRALEQIKVDAAYSRAHVVLCGQSPGLAYGELGPTHHSIEDLSWMRAIADLTVLVPAGPAQTRAAMRWAVHNPGPCYIRIGRFPVPETSPSNGGVEFVPGKALWLADGDDVTVIAIGTMVSRALLAAERLRTEGIGVRVLNMASIEPLDVQAVLDASHQTKGIVTVEEATVTGGLGSAVATVLAQEHPTPMRILGIPRRFAPTGNTEFLLDYFGLNTDGIVHAIRQLMAADGR